jgi:hypothetical protein
MPESPTTRSTHGLGRSLPFDPHTEFHKERDGSRTIVNDDADMAHLPNCQVLKGIWGTSSRGRRHPGRRSVP